MIPLLIFLAAGPASFPSPGSKTVTSVHSADKWDKPFLYPLRTPSGVVLSRGWPVDPRPGDSNDHVWHRGLFFGHGDINGHDLWRELGRVVMAKAWDVQLRHHIGRKPDSKPPAEVDYDTWTGAAKLLPFNENRFHYTWHWNWNYGTGDIGNDGIHQLDIARWALGVESPIAVSGMGRKLFFDDDQQTPDTMNPTFDFGEKALQFEMRIWNPYGLEQQENGVAVYGTSGMIHIGRWTGSRGWGYKVFDAKGALVESHPDHPGETGAAHARNFIDCVKSRKAPNADIAIGHASTTLSHLGNIVARTGRNLKFDAQSEDHCRRRRVERAAPPRIPASLVGAERRLIAPHFPATSPPPRAYPCYEWERCWSLPG